MLLLGQVERAGREIAAGASGLGHARRAVALTLAGRVEGLAGRCGRLSFLAAPSLWLWL